MLNTSTPFAKAIFELFTQLEELIQTQTNEPGACRAYLFGGCAVHIHTNARGSSDVDVELEAMKKGLKLDELVLKLDPVFYDDPEAGQEVLYYDETFNPTLAPLHEDYQQDAIPLEIRNNSPLWVYMSSPRPTRRFPNWDVLVNKIFWISILCSTMAWKLSHSVSALKQQSAMRWVMRPN